MQRAYETAHRLVAGRLLDDRYRLRRLLGSGGMASVWLADDQILRRPVAIKIPSDSLTCDDRYVARFRREAQLAARLAHRNLVDVYDFAWAGERPYLVMAYVPGPSLADAIGQPGEGDPRRLARELLAAVGAMHAAGILHRDIKPSNVLLDDTGAALLTDFGVAKADDATQLTDAQHIVGTVRFMAPEVLSGGPATIRSDLYGVGMVLAQTGSAALRGLVGRLTAADPAQRPVSAAAALELLGSQAPAAQPRPAARQPQPPASVDRHPTAVVRSRRPRRARVAVAAALAVVGALVAALALLSAGGATRTPAPTAPAPAHRHPAAAVGAHPAIAASRPPPIRPRRPAPTHHVPRATRARPVSSIPASQLRPAAGACGALQQQLQMVDRQRQAVARQVAGTPSAPQVLAAYATQRQLLLNLMRACGARPGA